MAELHRNFSQMFSNAYDDLGPYPLDEDPQASDFAAYCVDMTASELADLPDSQNTPAHTQPKS